MTTTNRFHHEVHGEHGEKFVKGGSATSTKLLFSVTSVISVVNSYRVVFVLCLYVLPLFPGALIASAAPADRLKVTSDLLSVYPDKNYTEFTGHVEAIYQGRLLKCVRLKAYFSKEAKQLDRIEAEEDVVLVDKEIEARCDRAMYYKDKDLVVLRGNPRLKSGENVFRGQVITVNLTTRRLTIEGGVEADIVPEQAKEK